MSLADSIDFKFIIGITCQQVYGCMLSLWLNAWSTTITYKTLTQRQLIGLIYQKHQSQNQTTELSSSYRSSHHHYLHHCVKKNKHHYLTYTQSYTAILLIIVPQIGHSRLLTFLTLRRRIIFGSGKSHFTVRNLTTSGLI
mgnify:CR=1 FL=1